MRFFELKAFYDKAVKAGLVSAVENGTAVPAPVTKPVEATPVASTSGKTIAYSAYLRMDAAARASFFKAGGRLSDIPAPRRESVAEVVPEKPAKTMTLTEFRKLPQSEKAKWCLSGGKLTD